MRKPSESIDDYIVPPASGVTSEPPRAVSLTRTGEVEVLQPLTRFEVRSARRARTDFKVSGQSQPLWFRRFLAVGSGALVMIAFVLVSAILVGIDEREDAPEVATSVNANDEPTQPEERFNFEVFSPSTFVPATGGEDIVRSNSRRRTVRPRVHLAAIKPKLRPSPSPQPEQPKFVPTTLVIYAENGVINTRIEPWLQFSN